MKGPFPYPINTESTVSSWGDTLIRVVEAVEGKYSRAIGICDPDNRGHLAVNLCVASSPTVSITAEVPFDELFEALLQLAVKHKI